MSALTAPKVVGSTALRLVRTELKLVRRDPLVLTFVLVFPIVTMLIIGGAFVALILLIATLRYQQKIKNVAAP